MKKIKKFNEAEEWIYGNPGIPGQPSRKEGEEDYLSTSWAKRKQQIRQQGQGNFDFDTSAREVRGHEIELELLLEKVFNNIYKGLVDRYNIKFDIKFADQRSIGNMLNISESIQSEKYKRKLINLVGQGEAKNMMYVFHNEEFTQGIYDIFGEVKGRKLINLWTDIVKAVDAIDVNRPLNGPWNTSFVKNTIGGACKIEWDKTETNEANDDYEEFWENPDKDDDETPKENIDDLIFKALQSGNLEEAEEIQTQNNLPDNYIRNKFTPKVIARGVDFTMLIHETIKGLYLILSVIGIPKEKEISVIVLNKGYAIREEPEEFKWGPMIAADLRDFINDSSKLTQEVLNAYPNIREQFWIHMLKMEADEFLKLFRGILGKTDESKITRDIILKKIIIKLHNYYENKRMKSEYEHKLKKYQEDLKKWKEKQKTKSQKPKNPVKSETPSQEEKEPDYANMSQKDLQNLMDASIDSGDYALANKISQYIK